MPADTPGRDRPPKERGLYAGHGDAPTVASYVSSLLHLLSFPAILALAFGGHLAGWYGYSTMIPVIGGLFVVEIVIVALLMHVYT